jgi:5S rRNA maturation endonuclease (ribonuclease M5)
VISSDEIYVVEGEKDVETLRAWGLVATCNPGGAGKWKEEYSRSLKGKTVIILQDNDPPGRKHSQTVAESVVRHAAEVRVIAPFPKAKDVTEWAEQGGTKRKLQNIVATTNPIERGDATAPDPVENESLSKDDWRAKPLRGAWAVRLPEMLFLDYLILPTGISFVASLWTIGTYFFEEFDCFPYLMITSPVKRCGKTRFGEILELLCCRSMMSVNVSEAALFRSIASEKPTIIIDEAESLRSRDSERSRYLLPILQAGFRQGAVVPRCVGKSHEVEKFSVYCPKAILAIGNLPDTLTDRSIVVSMRRHLKSEVVARFRRRFASQEAAGTASAIGTWANTHKEQVSKAYLKQNLDFLKDREADIWEPLFAIATVAVPERLEELKKIAISLSDKKASMDEDDSQGTRLLGDIRTFFNSTKRNEVSSAELVERLRRDAATHWGEELTQTKLARLLRPFGISSEQIWMDEGNSRGYRREQFRSAFECYLQDTR